MLNKLKELQCDFQIENHLFVYLKIISKAFYWNHLKILEKIVAPVVCSEYLNKFKDDGFIEMLP